MDFLFWYGMFWYTLGMLVAATFTWLWCNTQPDMQPAAPSHIDTIEVDHDAVARRLLAECDDLALE